MTAFPLPTLAWMFPFSPQYITWPISPSSLANALLVPVAMAQPLVLDLL